MEKEHKMGGNFAETLLNNSYPANHYDKQLVIPYNKALGFLNLAIQQERGRIVEVVNLLEFNAPKKYDTDPKFEQAEILNKHIMPVVRSILIKEINNN